MNTNKTNSKATTPSTNVMNIEELNKSLRASSLLQSLKENSRITSADFLPSGDNTKEQIATAKDRFGLYKAHFDSTLKCAILLYADISFGDNATSAKITAREKSVGTAISRIFKFLNVNGVNVEAFTKMFLHQLFGIKSITDKETNEKTRLFAYNSNTIRGQFEKCLSIVLNTGAICNQTDYNAIQHNNAVVKCVKACKELASKGKTKALANRLIQLADLTDGEEGEKYKALKTEINACLVSEIKPSSETPITTDAENGVNVA